MTQRHHGATTPRRCLAVFVATVLALWLVPSAALASHNADNDNACDGAPVADQYVDRDNARDVHQPSIDCVIYRAIAVGDTDADGDRVYRPLRNVNRGQMASFIAQALDAAGYGQDLGEGGGDDEFDDIAASPHRGNINRLARAGIVRGTGGDSYSPNDPVTRQQMASFIVQAVEFAVGDEHPVESDGDERFDDVDDDNPHKENIEAGADAEPVLFRGESDSQFSPGKNVLRDQMATFLINALRYAFDPDAAPAPVEVSITGQTVAAGGTLRGEITGDGVDAATVEGDCVSDGDVNDTNGTRDGIQFAIPVNDDATGECRLLFSIDFTDAFDRTRTVTRSATVTISAQAEDAALTVLPELLGAEVVETITNDNEAFPPACGESPPGVPDDASDDFQQTVVRFTFDENVTGGAPDAALFHLVGRDATTRHDGACAEVDDADEATVLVTFGEADNQVGESQVEQITLATVDAEAVSDDDGNTNPIGDTPMGETRTETFGQAGVTDAPDLLSVGDFESPEGETVTNVTFTFDETAYTAAPDGFHLITVNNAQIDCVATDDAAGGDPDEGADEQADETITVQCDESDLGRNITADDAARGFVDPDTVVDANPDDPDAAPGATNPLQSSNEPDGDTTAPDLESATFDESDASQDQVTYTFDESVLLGDNAGSGFAVYQIGGTQVTCDEAAPQRGSDNTTVRATCANGVLDTASGAVVVEGAVEGATGASDRANQEDEVGVANERAVTFAPGFTEGPDLIEIRITDNGDNVVYVLDDDVASFVVADDPDTADVNEEVAGFDLYLSDGTELECTDGQLSTDEPEGERNTVTCGTYAADGSTQVNATVAQAVAGTVDDGQVADAGGTPNPEGAQITAGSTGAPAQ